jgi:ADP-ribose pyrophosphatase YjhB (NUDIX family)
MKRDMVAGLIIRDRRLLLVHNTKHDDLRIEPPGGKKNDNEDWEGAVIREIQEEIGVKVMPTKLFGVYDTHSPEGEFSVHMYFCDMVGGEPRVIEGDKISGLEWYSFSELMELKESGSLVPNMCDALPKLKQYL